MATVRIINEATEPETNAIDDPTIFVGTQAFFLSIEFQRTGFLVHRFYKASFPTRPRVRAGWHYREFLRDTQEIGRGVVVGAAGWEQVLEANRPAFTLRWV